MGIRTLVEVLDHSPVDLTPAERLVLVALAERCRDDTRRVLPAADEPVRAMLMRRCGLGDSGLTKVLRRLAQREPSLDVRVPLGRDGHGRAVYAYEGRAAEFIVPMIQEGGREGSLLVLHSQDERAASGSQEGGREGSSGSPTGQALEPERVDERAALSLSPSEIPQPRATHAHMPADQVEAVASLLARFGPELDEDTAIACVVAKAPRASTNLTGYLGRFTIEDVRAAAAKSATRRRPAVEKCEHGTTGGQQIRGRGEHASRVCDRCEVESPATDGVRVVSEPQPKAVAR